MGQAVGMPAAGGIVMDETRRCGGIEPQVRTGGARISGGLQTAAPRRSQARRGKK